MCLPEQMLSAPEQFVSVPEQLVCATDQLQNCSGIVPMSSGAVNKCSGTVCKSSGAVSKCSGAVRIYDFCTPWQQYASIETPWLSASWCLRGSVHTVCAALLFVEFKYRLMLPFHVTSITPDTSQLCFVQFFVSYRVTLVSKVRNLTDILSPE